jgi:starch-binding outer membrane protein, SusD/RagB family
MKRLLLFFITVSILGSCNKVLDKKPTDFVDVTNYYSSEAELKLALTGVYDVLGNEYLYGSGLWYQMGICTDEGFYNYSSNAYSAPMFYQYDYTNPYVTGIWQQCYIGIERANLLIANINKPAMDETRRNVILGEALFLRAYYYFLLVSNYGDVPLKTTPTTDVNTINIPPTPMKEVYDRILTDMKDAETKVNTITTVGNTSRITKTAAQGILARVCLKMAGHPLNDTEKYKDALQWADKVVAGNEHALLATYDATLTNSAYSQIFINESRDVYEIKECIWEADFYMNDNSTAYFEVSKLGTMNLGCNNLDTGYAGSNIKTSIRLYNLYGAGDARRDWNICPFYFNSTTTTATRVNYTASNIIGREMGKWRRYCEKLTPTKQQYYNGANFPILRYADVLLMQAEAENEVNGATAKAYNAINQVRRRGYKLPVDAISATADLASGLSQTQFRQAIMDERARELCYEGLRKADLIRWGTFNTVLSAMTTEINNSNASATNKSRWTLGFMTAAASTKFLLLPIPSLEININKAMEQNPGW